MSSHSTHRLNGLTLAAQVTNARSLAAIKGAAVKLYDGGGLSLVVRPSGTVAWIQRYACQGVQREITLGDFEEVPLKIARHLGKEVLAEAKAGTDPLEKRRQAAGQQLSADVAAASDSVRALLFDWLAASSRSYQYRSNIEAAFVKNVLPSLGAVHPSSIVSRDIDAALQPVVDRGALQMAHKLRMWLRQMFEFGVNDPHRPWLVSSPVQMGTLPSFSSNRLRTTPAVTHHNSVGELMRSLWRVDGTTVRTALLMLAHTFQRPIDVREARWSELDLAARTWVIPAVRMLGHREHWCPLSSQVVELLQAQRRIANRGDWVFPGRVSNTCLTEGALTPALNSLGYKGLHSPSGFQEMARSNLTQTLGLNSAVVEAQLGLDLDGLLAHHQREPGVLWDERVLLMQRWSDWLDASADASQEGLLDAPSCLK